VDPNNDDYYTDIVRWRKHFSHHGKGAYTLRYKEADRNISPS
jgi:hypothetical protein